MNKYFITKTGLDFFDLNRAYGLGLLLYSLSSSTEKDVLIKDLGLYYQIESPEIDLRKKKEAIEFLIIPEIKKGSEWDYALKTLKLSKDAKKKKLKEYKEILDKNIQEIVKKYSSLKTHFEEKGKKKDTLYGTIEPAAFKGFRVTKRNSKYDEGSSYEIASEDIVLSLIGAATVGIWISGADGIILILGKPGDKGISVNEYRNIKEQIKNQIKFHRGGVLPTIIWTAVCLIEIIKQYEEEELFPLFDNLQYSVLKPTENQPKPEKGGRFSLDFLNKLSKEMDKQQFLELMETWRKIFQISNRAGLEELGISLSKFILSPNLENFELYVKIHLRYNINKNKTVSITYNQNLIKELTKYVTAS